MLYYDIVIIGAGISGLYVGQEMTRSSVSCCILERSSEPGGRIQTYREKKRGTSYQWEIGAGRISTTHSRVLRSLKDHALTFVPIQGTWSEPFTRLARLYFPPLLRLSPSILSHHTLGSLLLHVYGPTIAQECMTAFPYYSEFHTLRADIALQSLGPHGELHTANGFGVCAEGLSEWVHRMSSRFITQGGTILFGKTVTHLEMGPPFRITYSSKGSTSKGSTLIEDSIYAGRVVIAVDANSLRSIKGLRLPFLRHLRMEPLFRIYAVFPVHKGRSWFSGMRSVVLPTPIRFFIPLSDNIGTAMISYTEGEDARYWMKLPIPARKRALLSELRRSFPEKDIPEPLSFHFYPWTFGCTYWKPGSYDPVKESEQSIQPFPKVPLYLCGESFAVSQSWIESALVQAERVVHRMKSRM